MQFSRPITTIDAHAGGESLRIVTSGLPSLPGATMLERRRALRDRHDELRRLLRWGCSARMAAKLSGRAARQR